MAVHEIKVLVNYEMTDESRAVLRHALIQLLSEPEVLKILLEEFEKRLVQDIKLKAGME